MQNAKQRRLLSGGVVVNVDQGTSRRADVLIAQDRIEAVAAPDTLPPEWCEVLDMSEADIADASEAGAFGRARPVPVA